MCHQMCFHLTLSFPPFHLWKTQERSLSLSSLISPFLIERSLYCSLLPLSISALSLSTALPLSFYCSRYLNLLGDLIEVSLLFSLSRLALPLATALPLALSLPLKRRLTTSDSLQSPPRSGKGVSLTRRSDHHCVPKVSLAAAQPLVSHPLPQVYCSSITVMQRKCQQKTLCREEAIKTTIMTLCGEGRSHLKTDIKEGSTIIMNLCLEHQNL
ncbi:hypothetical protein CKAN_01224400 [Cinnamomum micranthum f. kanehirae]|uniref:Uncharacterized protein n=1 Tax=Cinnamomum micranthum f. kanehirae TaxID=337451 RepID=A0A443NY66_9MAGN|nr:hypothetical protein CKAN_01224400 [Cinnamomum micranthum f. kanehirae]